jgi:glycosyltransferase involved in cell wall biosynthesis
MEQTKRRNITKVLRRPSLPFSREKSGHMLWATFRKHIRTGGNTVTSNVSTLISAVIPTRNRPQLVVNAVWSALHQRHVEIEVIVVIDGEDRATEEELSKIEDKRLRVISLAVNVGGSEARNIGVRMARGEWIAFLDDDDEWLPQKLAVQLRAARQSESAFPVVSSRLIVRTPTQDFVEPQRLCETGRPVSDYLFCRRRFADGAYAMQTSTLLMRREMMLAIPFRPGLKMHQDWDWLLRASRHPGIRFHAISEPLSIFRVEDSRASVSRVSDWEFSLRWASEMRAHFTRRAYSFFLATECMSRAVKSKAGAAVYARIAWEFVVRGSPTARSLAWLAAFVCIPHQVRKHAREILRQRSTSSRQCTTVL